MADDRRRLIDEIHALREGMMRASSRRHIGAWIEQDLTFGQLKVLFLLFHEQPATMSAIAQALGVTLPAATNLIDKLFKAGMVERRVDSADRRLVLCELQLARRLRESWLIDSEGIFGRLGNSELQTVAEAMRILHWSMSERKAEPNPAVPGRDA